MKTIKIRFLDFWDGFDGTASYYLPYQLLKKHFNIEVTEDADYVIYSVFGERHWSVPRRCVKIFYTGENVAPDLNACDYAMGFEPMSCGDRYIRFPLWLEYLSDVDRMQEKHILPSDWSLAKDKPDFCSFVVTNPLNPVRNEFFEKLSAYKKVDSGGRYRNNTGGPVTDKLAFDRTHKFSICFENGAHVGYTTEKLVQAFAARTVPIYWGDPDVCRVFNEKAFVNVSDFADLDAAIERVREIDADDDLYLQMLRTPALREDTPTPEAERARLEAWLVSIFDRPLEEAYRRNLNFFGESYCRRRLLLDPWANRKELLKYGKARVRNKLIKKKI